MVESSPNPDPLQEGLADLIAGIRRAEAALRASTSFTSDLERAAGYQHLARSVRKAIESGILQDPDLPYFRILDFFQREGGDNPDQRYAFSPIRGGRPYRIWGTVGSARRVEIQLYSGDPWADDGQSVGYLPFEEVAVDNDGSFAVDLSPDRSGGGTWLCNPPEATSVFVRHIYDDWSEAPAGEVHIDLVGNEGARQLPATPADVAEGFRRAADIVERAAAVWPAMVQSIAGARPPNVVSDLVDTYALGGVQGRWMGAGQFDLGPGQALVLTTWPTGADYQAVQLTDMWFASLEYGNLVSSLTTEQSVAGPDGAFHIVICADDPGHPNWLDTGGRHRGLFLLRYDGVAGEIPADRRPTTAVVDLDDLHAVVPGWTAVDPDGRATVRAGRRRHLQIRTNR